MKTCTISGCDNKLVTKGLCSSHRKINKKYKTPVPLCWCGEPAQTNGGRKGASFLCKDHTLTARYWEYVDLKSENECWEWTGSKTAAGYGLIYWNNELQYAHRLSLEFDDRPVPTRWHACHTCDNPSCVNPKHLFSGTPRDNMQDKVSKGRHTFGENHPNSKLTKEDVSTIRQMADEGILLVDIASAFNITAGYVSEILSNRRRHLG